MFNQNKNQNYNPNIAIFFKQKRGRLFETASFYFIIKVQLLHNSIAFILSLMKGLSLIIKMFTENLFK